MSGWRWDQYACTKLLFTHTTQDLSKALLGASRNLDCWFVSYDCQLVCGHALIIFILIKSISNFQL